MEGRDTSTTVHDMEQIQRKDWFRAYSVSSAYSFADNDKIKTLLVTTAAGNLTITLPTVGDNTDRVIQIWKVDDGAGTVVVDGEGSETINGFTTVTLYSQYEGIEIKSVGTEWFAMNVYNRTISHVLAYRDSSVQSVNTATYAKVELNAELRDELSEFDNSVNYRFQPKIDDFYMSSCGAQFRAMSDGDVCQTMLYKNGAILSYTVFNAGSAAAYPVVPLTSTAELTSSDYLEFYVWHNHGSARDIGKNAFNTWMSADRLHSGKI